MGIVYLITLYEYSLVILGIFNFVYNFFLFIQLYFKKWFVTEALNMLTINLDNATILGKRPFF